MDRILANLADILQSAQFADGIPRRLRLDADRSQPLFPGLARCAGAFLAKIGKIVNADMTIGPINLQQPVVYIDDDILRFLRG